MLRILSCMVMLILGSSQASAALVYGLRVDNTAFSLNPGQSTVLNVFFDESYDPLNDTPRLDLASAPLPVNGLTTANYRISVSGTGTSSITAANGNALFDFIGSPTVIVGNPTTIAQDIDILSSPVFATQSSLTTRSILVGSFTVTAGGNPGDQNVFSLADFSGNSDFVIGDGLNFVADAGMTFGSATLTVTAVPEPSSMVLLSLFSGLGAYRVYRHKERTASKSA